MNEINLIPPYKKKTIESTVNFLFIKNILEISLIFASLLGIGVLMSWSIMDEEYRNLTNNSFIVSREYSNYNSKIKDINKLIKDSYTAQKDFKFRSQFIFNFMEEVPQNIKLTSIDFDSKNEKLIIIGTADDRDALINYQNLLKNSKLFSSVNSPFSQLLQKENINFEINCQLAK